jgi:nucleoside-diphosphate-sugar epimerase
LSIYIVTVCGWIHRLKVAELLWLKTPGFCVDNLSAAYDVRMKEHRLQTLLLSPPSPSSKPISPTRRSSTCSPRYVSACQAVINLAAMAGVRQSMSDPWSYLYTNTLGTLNLLEYSPPAGSAQIHPGFHFSL